jgi:hypothetical protein
MQYLGVDFCSRVPNIINNATKLVPTIFKVMQEDTSSFEASGIFCKEIAKIHIVLRTDFTYKSLDLSKHTNTLVSTIFKVTEKNYPCFEAPAIFCEELAKIHIVLRTDFSSKVHTSANI